MYARILKANPYHDAQGRFAPKGAASFVSIGGVFDKQRQNPNPKESPASQRSGTGKAVLRGMGNGSNVDSLPYEKNLELMESAAKAYNTDSDFRAAADVLDSYVTIQSKGLVTREVVSQTLAGRTVDQIMEDSGVKSLMKEHNDNWSDEISRVEIEKLAGATSGYFKTVRDAEPTTVELFRGFKGVGGVPALNGEFELRGPTAVSEGLDAAMTYSGGSLMVIRSGAKALPTRMMSMTKKKAEQNSRGVDEFITAPSFRERADNKIHPKGAGYGYRIGSDSDQEMTTSGRFKVVGKYKKSVTYTDTVSGKSKTKAVNYIEVEQVGVF